MNPWMLAHEAHQEAKRTITFMLDHPPQQNPELARLYSVWARDRQMLQRATPFAWDRPCVEAVWAMSQTLPMDTELTQWNLPDHFAWWHFAKPLPIRTVMDADSNIRALNMGWVTADCFAINTWFDGPPDLGLIPSQVFAWQRGESIANMLARIERQHVTLYGPGGSLADAAQVPVEVFLAASRDIARFVLAGLAWMDQRLLVQSPGPIERHRRKDFERKEGHAPPLVRVIQLRRTVHDPTPATPGDGDGERTYHCRWMVGGHWRQQACGPKMGDRKLTFISSYFKGPEDQPFRAPAKRVYEVSR